MQQFDVLVQPVGGFTVHGAGRYFKYLSGNNGGGDTSLVVTPGGQGGSKIVLQPGQAYRVADSKPTPDSWTLSNNVGGAAIAGKVVIGDGRIDDNSLQGVVQTVDGGKARTLANASFSGYGGAPAVAAQYGQTQLWNPAGSGVRLVLESMTSLGASTTSAMIVTDSTAALATLVQAGLPKLLGGSQSVGQIRNTTTASVVTANPSLFVIGAVGGAGMLQSSIKPVEPIVIPPGHGLQITGNTANNGMSCCFEWYEEPNV